MANRSGQYDSREARKSAVNLGPRPSGLAWLEWVLPLCAAAALVVMLRPVYVPRLLTGTATTPAAWIAWALVGALGGVMLFSALLVAFFLLYSPIYLASKAPLLVGKGGWTDRREVRFYGLCFTLLVVLAALAVVWLVTGDWRWIASVFLALTGFAPLIWRGLV